jgi:hypothetical protein
MAETPAPETPAPAPAVTPAPAPTPEPSSRADHRIEQLLARTKELEGRLKVAEAGEIEQKYQHATARATKLEEKLAGVQAEWTAKAGAWDTERTMMGHGLADAEAQDFARFAYNRIPAEGRPALGDWLAGIKADPTSAPAALAPYLAGTSAAPPPRERSTAPGVTPPDAPGSTATADAVRHRLLSAPGSADARKAAEDRIAQLRAQRG